MRLDAQHRKEGEDVRYDGYEVGHREAEHRAEVAPRGCCASAIATNLRSGILKEDYHTHNHHEYTSEDGDDIFVLLDLGLEECVEEEGDDSHQGVGTRHTQARQESRATALAERALDAQYGNRSHRD